MKDNRNKKLPKSKEKKKIKVQEPDVNAGFFEYLWYSIKVIFATIFSFFGALGWLFQGFLAVLTVIMIGGLVAGLVVFIKVKPDLDIARQRAYDIMATIDRSDFSLDPDTEVYDSDGNLIGIINAGHYEYVNIGDISLNLQNAYIAQEDRRFKEHTGVDWIATARAGLALIKNKGAITQGGSTITQQVIKNTYLTQEKKFSRKVVEILLAPEVEKRFSKADIMEFYCNTNFYGNRCYGVQAASRYYFGKDAKELEIWEAATLAGISNSPTRYNPVKNPIDSKEKRNRVITSMYEEGFISEYQYKNAITQPLSIVQETQEGTNENYQMSYAIHCAALELMKIDNFQFKYTYESGLEASEYAKLYDEAYAEASDRIRGGGYKIYTSLNTSLQAQVQESLDNGLKRFTDKQADGKYAMQGAAVLVDNTTNYIVAVVGGRGTEDQFNRAYLSARQPGSSIKPLIDYGPAFDTGEYYPSKVMNDHKWEGGPDNSGGGFRGNITIREALNRSINTIAWQVLQGIGVDKGLSYLGAMQFQKITSIDNGVEALSLGGFTNGLRVVDMAKGYSTLANNGVFSDRTCIVRLEKNNEGNILRNQREITKQVYQEDTAYMLTDVLKGTIEQPYGTGRGLGLNNMPAAGKTGTTNNNKDAWFCGYTKYYSAAVWMGYDQPKAMPGVFGATYAGKIWQDLMNKVHTGKEHLDWEQPPTVVTEYYKPSTGEKVDYDTGVQDLFSTTATLRATQAQYEREQENLASSLEKEVAQYENFYITEVEQVYQLSTQYQQLVDKLSTIQEQSYRTPLLERVTTKYTELKRTAEEMKDVVAEYEKNKKAQEEQLEKQKELEAEQKLQQEQENIKKEAFTNAMQKLKDLNYKTNTMEQLVEDARLALQGLVGLDSYDTASQELETQIKLLNNLPTRTEWEAQEAERKRIEAEQERLKAEAESKAAQERDNELQKILDEEKKNWGPGTTPGGNITNDNGPGSGPGSSTNTPSTAPYRPRFPGDTENQPEENGPGARH